MVGSMSRLKLIKTDPESGVVALALEIAGKRRNTLIRLKTAIRNQDLNEADRLITELVPDEESHRTNKSQYRRASR
jgi:hypothetical protein